MSNTLLSTLLIIFATIFLFIILAWENFRSIFGLGRDKQSIPKKKYNRLKNIHISNQLILIVFSFSSVVYLLFPATRTWFAPIYWLNNDYVNATGLVILAIAFYFVLRFQLKLDRDIHLYYVSTDESVNSSLVPDTEKNLLKSILLVYAGMFVVVSTVVTGGLLLTSFVIYCVRSSSRNYRIRTPLAP